MPAQRTDGRVEASDDQQLVLQSLFHASRAFKLALHPELEREGLTTPMWWALHELSLDGAMSVKAVATACVVTPANLSAALDDLVHAGLADRGSSPKDRRITLITATPKGRALHKKVWSRTLGRFGKPLRGVPRSDLEATARVLRRVAEPDERSARGDA